MNSGPVEEGGRTVRKLIDNLHDSPLTLALVLFNIIFLAIVYYSVQQQRDRWELFQNKLFEQQNKAMEMLYNCTPSKRTPDG
jgi:hypothetical protein